MAKMINNEEMVVCPVGSFLRDIVKTFGKKSILKIVWCLSTHQHVFPGLADCFPNNNINLMQE